MQQAPRVVSGAGTPIFSRLSRDMRGNNLRAALVESINDLFD
jgi:hypothetical protein